MWKSEMGKCEKRGIMKMGKCQKKVIKKMWKSVRLRKCGKKMWTNETCENVKKNVMMKMWKCEIREREMWKCRKMRW